MNRIEQEAIAKSLGLSRNELGKMVAAQAAQGEITKDQAAKMQGMTLEQLEQAEAAESLKKAFSKIAEPLASILNTLAPILTAVAKIVSFVAPVAPYFFLAYKGVKLLNSGLIGNIKNMGALLTKSKLFGKMYKGGQFMPGGGRAAKGGQRAGGLFSSLKDKILGKKR
jgi:VIT1/CCC1 family predicted Fe2+/Mn2+ transporter